MSVYSSFCKIFFLLVILFASQTEKVLAQQKSFGAALFKTKQHDFGRVPLGADAEFHFELTNSLRQDIRLLSVWSSCSCTAARLSTSVLRPGETGAVIARLNTSGQHLRERSAVLTVRLETVVNGSRRASTVQLLVSGYIRPDTVTTPGSVEFGAVAEGTSTERTVQLEYSGRPGWALTRIERSSPFLYAKAEEIQRSQGRVVYKITAKLEKDAPAGYIKDVLRLTTNEMQPGKSVPVEVLLPVQGVVTAPMQVQPSPLLLGVLSPEETVSKNMVIRSAKPFRVTGISSSDSRFRFAFSDQENTLQLVSVSFVAKNTLPNHPQEITDVISISTNDSQQPIVQVDALVRVKP